jgi:hypothetical protein
MRRADPDFKLTAPGQPPVTAHITLGSVTASPDVCEIFLKIDKDALAHMPPGLSYALQLPPAKNGYEWRQSRPITIAKPAP